MTHQPLSIIVVGGGIYGVTSALELRHRGHGVSLFDPGPLPHPNAASTDITKVIRMDYGADEFYMELMEEALPIWDAWNRDWPEPLYHETGFVIMGREPLRPGTFEGDSFALLTKRGHYAVQLDAAGLKRLFPAWAAERYTEGYFNPRAGWAASGKVVARLLQIARAAGVTLREGMQFARLSTDDARVTGIVTAAGEQHRADFVLVAAGAWTPTLLPWLSGVMWATGQPVLHFRPADPTPFQAPRFVVWSADIANTGWYGFPALADGTWKIANHGPGRRVHPDEPRTIALGDEAKFRTFLRETFPAMADAPLIGSRLCLYCDSWDGNFYIDHDPERPGLVVAAGDSGHAFKFAPVLGRIVADVLEQKPNRYASRFAWRARGRLKNEEARFNPIGA
jgi:glycine/D-amino acid oxidase-like deaminating enzyme